VERDPQRVSAVLADPTRYNIYQYVLTAPKRVSVAEVADRFGLHPNVARMHLGKLVSIGLLVAHAVRTGKGGRPGYLYGPSDDAISLVVPARDFHLLADLMVQALVLLGDSGKEAAVQVGRSYGRKLGREAMASLQVDPPSLQQLYQVCAEALQRLGVAISLMHDEGGGARFVLRTCGFWEVASAHPEYVCHLCKAIVEGVTEEILRVAPAVTEVSSRPRGDRECVYDASPLIQLQ
jgi:predicted ArsR family transcriptional regulator